MLASKAPVLPTRVHSPPQQRLLVLGLGLALGFWGLAPLRAQGQAPSLISYQGKIADRNGKPVEGPLKMVFAVYGLQAGGAALWSETQNPVYLNQGVFHVLLGAVTAMPANLFDGSDRWIGLTVGDDSELAPRSRIASVAYALRAASVGSTDTWKSSSTNAVLTGGNVGIGTSSPRTALEVTGTVTAQKLQAGAGNGLSFASDDGTTRFCLTDSGRVGIGTTAPASELDIAGDITIENRITATATTGMDLATRSGATRLKITDGGNVGIGTINPAASLHVVKSTGNARTTIQALDGKADLVLNGSQGSPTVTFEKEGVLQGSIGYDSVNQYLFLYENGSVVVKDGKLGVGTVDPQAALDVRGNLNVTGVSTGTFPRPNYDSGWVAISKATEVTFVHNLGGTTDNYVVDMQFFDADDSVKSGVNARFYGGWSVDNKNYGAYWRKLTPQSINVLRWTEDSNADQIRIRIWVYK